MSTVFDTLAFSRRLQQASFTPAQSDALAEAVHEAVRGSVATKADLDTQSAAIRAEIAALRVELEAQGAAFRADLATQGSTIRRELAEGDHKLDIKIEGIRAELLVLKWMTGAIVAGVLALVVKAFF